MRALVELVLQLACGLEVLGTVADYVLMSATATLGLVRLLKNAMVRLARRMKSGKATGSGLLAQLWDAHLCNALLKCRNLGLCVRMQVPLSLQSLVCTDCPHLQTLVQLMQTVHLVVQQLAAVSGTAVDLDGGSGELERERRVDTVPSRRPYSAVVG